MPAGLGKVLIHGSARIPAALIAKIPALRSCISLVLVCLASHFGDDNSGRESTCLFPSILKLMVSQWARFRLPRLSWLFVMSFVCYCNSREIM